MIAIDTNVLVRMIVDDKQQPQQTVLARELTKNADKVYISQVVQVECIWVLTKVYKLNKNSVLAVLETLANNCGLVLENRPLFNMAVTLFKDSKADFADCLVLAQSLQVDALLHTFDKRLANHTSVKLVN